MNSYQQTDNQIDTTTKPLEVVGGLLSSDYLKRFRVFKSKSLFEPSREELIRWLSQERCPLCYRKLYWNRDQTKAFCKSKFKDKFFITKEAMKKYKI